MSTTYEQPPDVTGLLTRALGERDAAALAALDGAVCRRIWHYVRWLGLPSDVDAEDVAQEVMIAILKGFDVARRDSFWAFAFKIARNKRQDEWRKWSRDPLRKGKLPVDNKPDESPVGPYQDELQKLAECQKKLARDKSDHAKALALKYNDELSYRQIAEALETPVVTVIDRVRRALIWLRDCMNSRDAHAAPSA